MLTMDSEPRTIKETTIRMDQDLADRLSVVSQVLGISMNQLMVNAIKESVMLYENDSDYQDQRAKWLDKLKGVGTG